MLLLLASIAVIACAGDDAVHPAAAEIQKRKQSDYGAVRTAPNIPILAPAQTVNYCIICWV